MSDPSIFEEPKHVAMMRRMRLLKPEHRTQALRRLLLSVLVAWLPPALLCLVQWLVTSDDVYIGYFTDVAVYARFLLAVPILILSEYLTLPQLDATARQFANSRIIDPADHVLFEDTIAATRRLSLNVWPSAAMTVVVYLCVIALAISIPSTALPSWHRLPGSPHLSPAGWWHMFGVFRCCSDCCSAGSGACQCGCASCTRCPA